MIFTDGEKVLGTISVMPVLGEGEYEAVIQKEINVKEWVGRRCIITIKHNVSDTGKVYANIVERKFI